jgi:hypothetical protein
MKKMVFIAGALMLIAGTAMAGSDLGWNDCVAGGGAADRTVTCTNSGTGVLYLSFNPASSIPNLGGSDGFIDVVPSQSTIAAGSWWFPATFTTRWGTGSATGLSGACPEWYAGTPNFIVFSPSGSIINAGRLRVRVSAVVPTGEEQPVDPGNNYFAGSLSLKFSTGTAGNAECTAGGAIGVYDINLLAPGIPDTHLGQTPEVSNCATFRGGGGKTCPGATPTQKATWGSIKALYR